MKKYYIESKRRGISYIQYNEGRLNRIGHILRRNYILIHLVEGKIEGRLEVTGRGGRRLKELLDGPKEKVGYWKLREETLDRTLWQTGFGRGYVPVVCQPTG
jgi:hypothetical protein